MVSNNPLEKKVAKQFPENKLRTQKITVVFLAVLAIIIVSLWGFQLSTQLNKPFAVDQKINKNETAKVTDLHLIDSDGDGLSDYDEINVYHTSPYLEDSDSDGILDKQEILQGTDPNCPTGKICTATPSSPSPASSSTVPQIDTVPVVSGEATIVPGLGNEVTPAMLRQMLLQNGYDAATLDKISDADIMRSYQEALSSQSSSTVANPSAISQ